RHDLLGNDLGKTGGDKPEEVGWRDAPGEGKLDPLATRDFRMPTTCLYSDIVLPAATWHQKNGPNTSDMHPFTHPLTAATDPAWPGKRAATGTSTTASPRHSPGCASVTWGRKPT